MTTTREATTRPRGRRRVAQSLAADVREQVVSGRLRAGEFLGREPELMGRYGVSRASLREGLRLLESEGFVRVRRGPGGGVFAERPGHASAGASLASLLRMRGAGGEDVAEAHELLENLRGLAAHRDNATLALLTEVLATLDVSPEDDDLAPAGISPGGISQERDGRRLDVA